MRILATVLVCFLWRASIAAEWCLTNAPNCVANWRASDIVTNGSVVSIPDYNGSAYSLSNGSTASTWPIVQTNSIGGQNTIRFDGTNHFVYNPNFQVSQPFEMVLIYKYRGASDNSAHWIVTSSILNSTPRVKYYTEFVDRALYANAGVSLHYEAGNTPPFQWKVDSVGIDGANSYIYINENLGVSGNAGDNDLDGIYIGCYPNLVASGQFDLAEIAIYSSTNSPASRSNIVAYFMDFYNGGASLPGTNIFYASPSGAGDGSLNNPWNLNSALSSEQMVPGSTLYLRGGTYYGPFYSLIYGTTNDYINVLPYGSERVILAAGTNQTAGAILEISGQGTVFQNIEIMNTSTNRLTEVDYAVGVSVYGPYNKIINCSIHDTGEGIWVGLGAYQTEIYGCWIFNNGGQNFGVDSRGHGHGIYARSMIPTTLISDNIIFNQFGLGIQCYTTSSRQPLNGFTLDGNISFGNGRLSESGDGECNMLVAGGGLVDNLIVQSNFLFSIGYDCGANSKFGSGQNPGDTRQSEGSAIFSGNRFFGSYNYVTCFTNVVFTNNFMAGDATILWLTFTEQSATSTPAWSIYDWNNNIYNLSWSHPFFLSTNSSHANTFATWVSTGFDVNSSFSAYLPTQLEAYTRTNKYNPNRAHLVVINWPTNDNVSVDLSHFLSEGAGYRILNGQNPLAAAVVSGAYSNVVSIPMTNLSVAIASGHIAPPSVAPLFGVFIVEKINPATSTIGTVRANTLILRQ